VRSSGSYIVCTRALDSAGNFRPEPGPTSFLHVPTSRRSFAAAQRIDRERWRRAVIASASGPEDPVTGATGDLLFFVHGYNNDAATVLWRTRTLQRTLAAQGWRGLVVAFDWPSDNSTLNYLEDRRDASQVAHALVDDALQLLIDAQYPAEPAVPPCRINVHLLGHSTGAYVIMEAFANAAKRGEFFRRHWRIGQVAFIAGDVASSSLGAGSDWAQPMYERIFRLTNYSNGFDRVLAASSMKRLGTSPRAGRVGVPQDAPRKLVNVDCSAYFARKSPATSEFTGTFNHSWHIGDPVFALDLALTLEGAIDRNVIPTRAERDGGLVLVGGGRRPRHQARWDAERPA
jgi:pimeloyl-ACP methyl ester carboxylesterase